MGWGCWGVGIGDGGGEGGRGVRRGRIESRSYQDLGVLLYKTVTFFFFFVFFM